MNKSNSSIIKSIQDSISIKQAILDDSQIINTINQVTSILVKTYHQGNKVILAGNGGSAADAQHLAAELVSRFEFDRPGLPAISLATDTSMITAIGNDYGYENLFLRQLQAQARAGDVFVGITTSGRSTNILKAFDACSKLGVTSVALCGTGGELEGKADFIICVPSRHTARIQESHIMIGHLICAEVELQVFGHLAPNYL